jgi:tetracycline 7-halogenase / FADH2 O2-dependent halogenase
LQNTFIKDINVQPDGVEIITNKDKTYRAEYIIDAGGMKSILAQKFNWRHRDLMSHSRTIFTHMIDVPGFNEVYPQRDDLTPEQEFRDFIQRFPDLAAQLEHAKPVRDFMRIDRLQYSAHHIVADRYALLAHAAGFIDPLYSKGLYVTHASIFLMADLLLKAKNRRLLCRRLCPARNHDSQLHQHARPAGGKFVQVVA